MKSILKITLVAFVSVAFLSGCIKEVFPTDGATSDQVTASPSALQGMVQSLPAAMTSIRNYPTSSFVHYDFGYPALRINNSHMDGDLLVCGDDNYNHFWFWDQNVYNGPSYVACGAPWYTLYPWIKICNDIIKLINPETATPETKAYLGIALAYRANFYLDLVRYYEFKENEYTTGTNVLGLGVPIVTEATTEDVAKNNPRAQVSAVYDMIFADLDNAETYLKGYKRTSRAYPNLAVVYGMKARAWLERGSAGVTDGYKNAAEYAAKAIAEFGGKPMTQAQWEDPTNGFNNADAQNWMLSTKLASEQTSNVASFTAHMSSEESWTVYGYKVARGINKQMYDAIPNKDFRKHSWLDPKRFDFYKYQSCRPDAEEYFGDGETLPDYTNIKFRPAQGKYTDSNAGGCSDVPLMRVEEMYLIQAEAVGMSQGLAAGQTKLQEFMAYRITDGSYKSQSTTQAEFQKEVVFQKRVEFWGEGVSYFDKKRLGLGIQTGYKGTNAISAARWDIETVAPWWNICIPRNEINNNQALKDYNNPDPTGTVTNWK